MTNPWESGSEFDHRAFEPLQQASEWPFAAGELYGSGRDALRALLETLVSDGIRTLFVPDYFCHKVLHTAKTILPLQPYVDDPRLPSCNLPDRTEDQAILVHNPFGLRPQRPREGRGIWIEDHSHHLTSAWAHQSQADYAFASLRKTLPVPDGGVLWSPTGRTVPKAPPITPTRELAAYRKLAGMNLKGLYLGQHPIDKPAFRRLQTDGEGEIAAGEISGISSYTRALLPALPWQRFERRKAANARRLMTATHPDGQWLRPAEGAVAFAAIWVANDQAARDAMRARLVADQTYPAVLWPMDAPAVPPSAQAQDLANRILIIHTDQRYGPSDMDRIGKHFEPFV